MVKKTMVISNEKISISFEKECDEENLSLAAKGVMHECLGTAKERDNIEDIIEYESLPVVDGKSLQGNSDNIPPIPDEMSISPSNLTYLPRCPRCLYLQVRMGIRSPSISLRCSTL